MQRWKRDVMVVQELQHWNHFKVEDNQEIPWEEVIESEEQML